MSESAIINQGITSQEGVLSRQRPVQALRFTAQTNTTPTDTFTKSIVFGSSTATTPSKKYSLLDLFRVKKVARQKPFPQPELLVPLKTMPQQWMPLYKSPEWRQKLTDAMNQAQYTLDDKKTVVKTLNALDEHVMAWRHKVHQLQTTLRKEGLTDTQIEMVRWLPEIKDAKTQMQQARIEAGSNAEKIIKEHVKSIEPHWKAVRSDSQNIPARALGHLEQYELTHTPALFRPFLRWWSEFRGVPYDTYLQMLGSKDILNYSMDYLETLYKQVL